MAFTPEQKVLNDLFGNDLSYEIPSYQRPYSWAAIGKSDKDNQVNVMWEDLITHFKNERENIYFMGSMVLIGEPSSRNFKVVDGQQRLTTLTLLFVAIRCMLEKLKDEDIVESKRKELKDFIKQVIDNTNSLLFNKKLLGAIEQEKKVKIQITKGYDYDKVLKMALECGNFDTKDGNEEQKKVASRYFANRDYFVQKLEEQFLSEGMFTYEAANNLNDFIDFLKNKVTIVRILSTDFDLAYQIFEVLNNRGLPLSNKDLFRNFIISEMYQAEIEDPEQKWLQLDNYEFNSEFISRYVESTNAKKQRYSAFNDIQDIYMNQFSKTLTESKIQVFYKDIEKTLEHYTNIELELFDNKAIKHRVAFLKNAGNSRYIVNLLIALFKNTAEEVKIIQFLSELELYVIYLLLGPSKRFLPTPIFEAIAALNNNKFEVAISKIALQKAEKTDLKDLFDKQIKDNDWAKLMIARYVWAIDIDNPKDVISIDLDYKRATLEHIIPQTPDKNTNWLKDFTDDFKKNYTYKLGNMTLLTQRMNSKVKNYDFQRKKESYSKMKLETTRDISKLEKIDAAYIENRHKDIKEYLIKHFKL